MREYLRGIFCSTGKFDGTSLLNKKALRANDAHSREDEDRRERPRSARECAEAHSFLGLYKLYEILTDVSWGKYGMRVILIDKLNTYGIANLHCMEWIPSGEVKAIVQIAHGMMEHVGRYREFAEFLAGHGIYVLGNDHLGHGKTAAAAEDRGYFGEHGGAVSVIRDMRRVTVHAQRKYPGVPIFLLGHSMGSFFARRYLTVYKDGIDGVILLGTGAPKDAEVRLGYLLADTICRQRGTRCRSKLLYEMSLGNYNRKFKPVKTPYDWLSRDEKKDRDFGDDPLTDFIFTAGAYRDFFEVILKTAKLEKAGKMRTDLPILILSGSKDPVGEETKGVRRVYERYDKAGAEDLSIGFYEDARHELLNELNRDQVSADILEWIGEHEG